MAYTQKDTAGDKSQAMILTTHNGLHSTNLLLAESKSYIKVARLDNRQANYFKPVNSSVNILFIYDLLYLHKIQALWQKI